MPRLELIPNVYYQSNDPIHWEYDNLPLKSIVGRLDMVNNALDGIIVQVRDAIGTQGTMSNRLNQSINADGSLKSTAIDDSLHSIEEHADTDDYVRMTSDERDKLAQVADGATDVSLIVGDGTSEVQFTAGAVRLAASSTITPTVEAPNSIKLELAFSSDSAHQHYYGLTPVHTDIVSPDYTNYQVNSLSSPFMESSLRVYINGIRIFEDTGALVDNFEVYTPGELVDDAWTLMSFISNHANGTFQLSSAITSDDVLKIDFDLALT